MKSECFDALLNVAIGAVKCLLAFAVAVVVVLIHRAATNG